jgi:hypothetical protein
MLVIRPSRAQSIRMPTMQSLVDGQTFRAAKLSSTEMDGIFKEVEKTSFDYPDSWQSELRARRVSLGNADGLVIQGTKLLCGGTGNCQTWVFRSSNGRWISMFQGQAPIISAFGFAGNKSHGIKDLATVAHLSAENSAYSVFVFDGNFYRETHCYEISGLGSPEAKWHSRKKPCVNAN